MHAKLPTTISQAAVMHIGVTVRAKAHTAGCKCIHNVHQPALLVLCLPSVGFACSCCLKASCLVFAALSMQNPIIAQRGSSLLGSWRLCAGKDIHWSSLPAFDVADITGVPGGASAAMPAAFRGQQLHYHQPGHTQ